MIEKTTMTRVSGGGGYPRFPRPFPTRVWASATRPIKNLFKSVCYGITPKMPRKPSKKATEPQPDDLSDMERLIASTKAEVEAHLETAKARREALVNPEHLDPDLVGLLNSLARSATALSAEQRQLEKHTRIRLEKLTAEDDDAIVREFLESLPRGRRKAFLELLQGLDSNNDLLSL